MKSMLVRWLAIVGVGLVVGCGPSGGGGPPAIVVSPAAPSVSPRGTATFTASGGNGIGYAWSIATNASGGAINATTGSYTAGATGGVTDVVRVIDSAGAAGSANVTVGPGVSISPATASVAPRGSQAFTASGGSGTGYAWSIATNASGGTISTATGAYTAGATPDVTDVIQATDSLGNTATRNVTVTSSVSISPATASVAPRGSQAFTASGGSGSGYVWTLSTNASGGTINASTGAYTAGATPNVTDVVQATDSLGNTASRNVAVTVNLSISPATASVAPRGSLTFTASGGSGTGFAWTLATDASGGNINASTGAYTAGATPNVTDVVRATDSLGNTASRNVAVGAGVSVTPATVGLAPGGTQAFAASGGSGAGYAWSLSTNASGGNINPTTGAYTAGATSGTDSVRVTDSLGNSFTATANVTANLSITASATTTPPRGAISFSAAGGSGGYTWALATNASGGSINASTGAYVAGSTGSVTDVVRVTDSQAHTATQSVTVTVGVSISPSTVVVARGGTQAFTGSGGSSTGYAWALATNASGGNINASTGIYTAGATAGTDVVRLTDSLGNTATRNVTVTGALSISPATVVLRRTGTQTFTASGGSGTGYAWTLTTNASGGNINASTGAYTAGATAGTDVVQVADSVGNTATRSVTVTSGVTISPSPLVVRRTGTQTFTASGGSGTGYAWTLTTNASGGNINASTGAYTAGPTAGADVVQLTDSVGNTATSNVTVTPAVTITPASANLPALGTRTFVAGGGSGTGYAWSLTANPSGGNIVAGTGVYTAGSTTGVADVVQLLDSVGNTATASVNVRAPIVISPATVGLFQGATQTFTATGGSGGFTWSLPTQPSGGNIVAGTGAYTAGATGGVTDVVQVTDSVGGTATRNVTVYPFVSQRWQAPTTWGGTASGFWSNSDAGILQHATFAATGVPNDINGITWGLNGSGTIPNISFGGFAFPLITRNGRGPFPTSAGLSTLYHATAGSNSLDLTGDMLACAVIKPDYNPGLPPASDGFEKVIFSKGIQGVSGWVLMQMHQSFCFHYQGTGTGETMAFTPTYVPDNGPGIGPLNTSYVVVCGGRDNTNPASPQIAVAANGIDSLRQAPLIAGEPMVISAESATIGGYNDNSQNHRFGGVVYETAVWNIPATPANIQAKMAAVMGLFLPNGTVATYTRNHEGPYTGADGLYHTQWRHGPRFDPAGKGLLFGNFGVNHVTNPAVAGGIAPEGLGIWTPAGGAFVDSNVRVPPSNTGEANADRVTLPRIPAGPGVPGSISTEMTSFSLAGTGLATGPVEGQIWIYLDTAAGDTAAGTLRVRTTVPGTPNPVDMGSFDINLATITPNTWRRIWIGPGALTTNGSQLALGQPSIALENGGNTNIQFVAWGLAMSQIGGPRYLPDGFDPGFFMYDSLLSSDYADVLQLPPITASNAGTGFCLSADVQPSPGLAWAAPTPPATYFDDVRAIIEWWNGGTGLGEQSARIVIGGDLSHSAMSNGITFRVTTAGDTNYHFLARAPPAGWTAGSKHTIKACVSPTGQMQIYGDNVAVGDPFELPVGTVVPDLATGHVSVGNDHTGGVPWFGWVSKALACPFAGDVTQCL